MLAAVTVATVPSSTASTGQEPGPRAERPRIAPAQPLLDGPARGRKAIRELGDRLPAAAARNDLPPARLRSLLRTDSSVWVDPQGSLYYVDPVYHDGDEQESSATPAPAASSSQVAPLSETFALHSNPGASKTILLDFDGASVTGSWWNTGDMPLASGTHPAWDPAGDGPGFSDGERLKVQQVWAMVAEDFAPFDVDVTTEDPGSAGMVRSSLADTVYGTRVLITPSADALTAICGGGCGGSAYLGVFDRVGSLHQPAWVFPQALGNDAKSIAEATSHEAGHNLGLKHDGGSTSPDYYRGHGIWAPIMGVGYDRPLVQWSAGSYPGATNHEDDLGILTGYLGPRPDEASGSVATPSPLPEGPAYIGTSDDADAYLLGSCTAGATVEVRPTFLAPNLDVRATLHDADGTQRAVAAPASGLVNRHAATGLDAALTVPADGAQWVVTVEGAGHGTWTDDGYDGYGSLGAYTVSAPGCDGAASPGVPSAPSAVATGPAQVDALTLTWSAPASEGSGPVTAYVVNRSGSAASTTLPAAARSHTFTDLTPGTAYQLSVRAANATGAGTTATVTATTSAPPAAAPSAPRNLAGSYDPASNTLDAWWSEPSNPGTEPITGYAITLDGYPLGQAGSQVRRVEIGHGVSFPEGRYVVGVAAVNAIGSSPVATVSITVARPSSAAPPTTMKPPKVVVRGRKAVVKWAAANPQGSPVTRYLVDISKGKDRVLPGTTRTTAYKLRPGRYRVRVAARNVVGTSPYSRWVAFRVH